MNTSYEDVFLSDIMKQILGLYKLENPSAEFSELINDLSIGKLKKIHQDLSKDSREVLDLPVGILFKTEHKKLKKALLYMKYQYYYGETANV